MGKNITFANIIDIENGNKEDLQRLGQLKNLVMLASADEKMTDSELAVLLAVAILK